MKKRGILLISGITISFIVGILLCSFMVLSGHGQKRLDAPQNVKVDQETKVVTWDAVVNSTGGYLLEISGIGATIPVEYKDFDLTELDLSTGDYEIRVKALTIDHNYFTDSAWSAPAHLRVEKPSGVEYRLINSETEYEIARIGSAKGDVHIFATHNGLPITSVGYGAFSGAGKSGITSVTLGPNIKTINDLAFAGVSKMVKITLPEGVTYIGNSAFTSCLSLEEINIPSTVTFIGTRAFMDCAKLKTASVPDLVTEVPVYAFGNCKALESVTIGKNVTNIGVYAFLNCVSLKGVVIPDSVLKVSDGAFYGAGLESLTMGRGVMEIGIGAFQYCEKLEYVDLPDSLSCIRLEAFYGTGIWINAPLYSIVYIDDWAVGYKDFHVGGTYDPSSYEDFSTSIREGTVGVSDYAFALKERLQAVTLPKSLRYIGAYAFRASGIWNNTPEKEVVYAGDDDNLWIVGNTYPNFYEDPNAEDIPLTPITLRQGVVGVSDYAFFFFDKLQYLHNMESIKYIGASAFYFCENFESTIPSSIEIFGSFAFYGCGKVQKVELSPAVTVLPERVFAACASLTEVNFPANLRYIGHGAFAATKINNVDIRFAETLEYIGDYAFADSLIGGTVYLPDSIKYLGEYAFSGCANLRDAVLPSTLKEIPTGLFFVSRLLGANEQDMPGKGFDIPEGVTKIGDYAFAHCVSLTEFYLPASVTTIGEHAFWYAANIETFVMTDNVTTIGASAFRQCIALKNLTLSQNVIRLERYVFMDCKSLEDFVFSTKVRSVADYAFVRCESLKSITLSKNLVELGNHVFFGCVNITIYSEHERRPAHWGEHFASTIRRPGDETSGDIFPPDYESPDDPDNNSIKRSPVIWGCILSEDKKYVVGVTRYTDVGYAYDDEGNAILETATNIPSIYNPDDFVLNPPHRAESRFLGWSTVSSDSFGTEGSVNLVDVADGVPLFAVWE